MSSPYPVLDDRPIDQWRVTELKEELKRRKLPTKGLKEDLLKRLSRALFSEPNPNEDADNGSDNLPNSDLQFEDEKIYEIVDDIVVASQPEVVSEEGKSESLVSRTSEAGTQNGTNTTHIVNINSTKEDEGCGSVVDGKDTNENVIGSVSTEDKLQAEIFIQEPTVVDEEVAVVKEDIAVASVIQLDLNQCISHDEKTNLKPELESEILLETKSEVDKPTSHANDVESRSAHPNSLTISSRPDNDNQVCEISLAVGIQVKSDFSSPDSGFINEKYDVKNNMISDMKLQVEVTPEKVQPSSSTAALDIMETDSADVEGEHEKKTFLGEKDGDIAKTVDFIENEDSGDAGSPQKLNLDRSSGDDSMEEDALESKQNSGSDLLGPNDENIPLLGGENSNTVAVGMPLDTKVSKIENEKSSAAASSKRKLHDQSAVENDDITKRHRRTQPDSLRLPSENVVNTVAFTKRNDAMHPTVRGGFSKLESADNEAPKERVVPPSAKPPTNSLRIDRFLRPFTLKAVQDLLGKTGTVVSFWMDNIKTHCFVTFSSVEGALETRNAVYNLQWPTNGGRLLIADFVDPQEVKARVEGPLPSPMTLTTPAGLRPNFPSAQPAGPPQPLPRQQVQRQQLPLPRQQVQRQQLPPPPPLLTNPLAARENVLPIKRQMAAVKEQLLPPPPPVSEKVDPPALTLDDLFRKTIASPRIYYLPLSDEQVAAKLNVQGNNIKQ